MAVRGIAEHGLPILPSGLLYDRGILYSYVSWVAHALTGSELPAYRAISMVSALIALWLAFALMRRVRDRAAGLCGAVLVATSMPFWATATSGRFYAPFLALYLATLLLLQGSPAALVAVAFLCRLTHELAFTLAAVPVVAALVDHEHRRRWLRAAVGIVAGLVAGQALLFVLQWMTPTSGATMVRRFFLWQVLNLFERPQSGQFAIALVAMVVGWLIAPRRAWAIAVPALSLTAMMVAYLIARASNTTWLSMASIGAVLADGSRYPLDMFWHIAHTMPLAVILAGVLLMARLAGAGGEWTRAERGLHGLWLGWVLWFGVIDSGITANYLLLPVSFMVMAIANDVSAILISRGVPSRRWFSAPSRAAYAGAAGIMLMVAVDQWRGASLDEVRPTINVAGIEQIRSSLQPRDRVACTDELGCLMLVGRIDRWLALDDFVRERFLVRRGDAPVSGVYTGVPAVFRPGDLFGRDADGTIPDRIVIVDVFKDYPIGNSRNWLPRAIAADGVEARVLLETSQVRILEITPPTRNAVRIVGATPW